VAPIELFAFRFRDPRTGKWVRARYRATRAELAARYREWEVNRTRRGRGDAPVHMFQLATPSKSSSFRFCRPSGRTLMTVRIIAVALFALSGNAGAADLYRCQIGDGKVEYRDRPCDKPGTGVKLDIQANALAPLETTETKKRAVELNRRITDLQRAEDAHWARVEANRPLNDERCRMVAEAILKQQASLGATSPAVQQRATNEIAIQRQLAVDYGCR
jgi:hypothetical protein